MRWFDRRDRVPECVVADRGSWEKYARSRGKHQLDPLRDWITANYRPVSQTKDIVVLQRGA
jgi:hypothetical protein